MKAIISEIFKSIQGEGIYQKTVQVFVRFYGCNLKCGFCDTELNHYTEKSARQLYAEINKYSDYHSISLTGGEPLLQTNFLKQFAQELKHKGKKLYLETNGIFYQNLEEIIDFIDIISMDFKLPSSTGLKGFWNQHREFLKIAGKKEVFIKVVVGKNTLIEDVRVAIAILKELRLNVPFVLQPQNPYEDLLKDKLRYFKKICEGSNVDVRIIPQLHKTLNIK